MGTAIQQQLSILGLSGSVTTEDVKVAYRRLLRHYHPDRFVSHGDPELVARMTEKCKEINDAYSYLCEKLSTQGAPQNFTDGNAHSGGYDRDLQDGEQAIIVEISPADDFFNRREFWVGCRVQVWSPIHKGDGWYCIHTNFQAGSRQLAEFAEGALFARVRLRRVAPEPVGSFVIPLGGKDTLGQIKRKP